MGDLDGAPWWLIVILLVLGVGVPASGSEKAATLPGLLGAGARWWQGRRSQRRSEAIAEAQAAAEPSTSERVALAELDRVKQNYESLRADCAQDRRDFTAQIGELRTSLADVKASLTLANQQVWAAIGSLRVHRSIVEEVAPHRLPAVPDKLKEIL